MAMRLLSASNVCLSCFQLFESAFLLLSCHDSMDLLFALYIPGLSAILLLLEMLVLNPGLLTILLVDLLSNIPNVTMFAYFAWGLCEQSLSSRKLLLTRIHDIVFPLAFSLDQLLNFHMEYILLEYGRNRVFVWCFEALYADIRYTLQYTFAFLEAYWGNKIAFSLLGMYGTVLGG